MREIMNIFYRPEIHNGVKNHKNYMHCYRIELDESFENRSNNEKFAGIDGIHTFQPIHAEPLVLTSLGASAADASKLFVV